MYLEDVVVKSGDTVSGLAKEYGYKGGEWTKVWDHAENAKLKTKRGRPEKIQPGDTLQIPIPWKVKTTTMTFVNASSRVRFEAIRTGERGTQIRWAQTVDRHNQAFGNAPYGQPREVVDPGSPPDDNEPFYFTDTEIASVPGRRTKFSDTPFRTAPAAPTGVALIDWARTELGTAVGTTKWRALLSIAIVTDKRVTVIDTQAWGFDKAPTGTVTKVPARKATATEMADHLKILKGGFGLKDVPGSMATFASMGWTFRLEPSP
ncbi:MAG: LysM peptidoglycan-binding domain-containing protein [Pseudomonadota bacterium]